MREGTDNRSIQHIKDIISGYETSYGRETRSGFAAFKRMLLANPVTYFFFAAAVLASGWVSAGLRSLVIAALVAFFFPMFSPVGEAVYNWIARNRHLMMDGERFQTDWEGIQICSPPTRNLQD